MAAADQSIITMAMQQMQPLTALGGLTETVRQQRMVLAQEGTHQQYAIKLAQRADRHLPQIWA